MIRYRYFPVVRFGPSFSWSLIFTRPRSHSTRLGRWNREQVRAGRRGRGPAVMREIKPTRSTSCRDFSTYTDDNRRQRTSPARPQTTDYDWLQRVTSWCVLFQRQFAAKVNVPGTGAPCQEQFPQLKYLLNNTVAPCRHCHHRHIIYLL